ncbi:MAG: exopolysaccharide biosynthesis polyprenyl glycosylphosphotransferase [Geminicoccaceae bacterium]|nr:exopolysaccharide biosynthesis polyprenyl glycosylphosphotransferase [Geminicoccaceae bacterium]MDW8340892.1 exopolysaccharide biosynthesis polyprenyl glycosylphosphotransferase [Geminicoccaceae bacterium]
MRDVAQGLSIRPAGAVARADEPEGGDHALRAASAAAREAVVGIRRREPGALPESLPGLVLAALDALVVLGAAVAVFYGFYAVRYADSGLDLHYAALGGLGALFLVQRLWSVGAYSCARLLDRRAQLRLVASSWTIAAGLVLLTLFFLRGAGQLSRGWFLGWYLSALPLLLAIRTRVPQTVRELARSGRIARRILALVGPEPALSTAQQLLAPAVPHLRVSRIRLDGAVVRAGEERLERVLAETRRKLRAEAVDTVLVLPFGTDPDRQMRVLGAFEELPVDLWYCPAVEPRLARAAGGAFGPLPAILVRPQPLDATEQRIKRLFDFVVAALALVLLAPLFLLIVIAIKLDSPGPIFFRQIRFGYNNRPFAMLKFRTMRADACDPSGARRTVRNDPRVTRIGRLLRRTSLDELPQLWNVLVGEMSLVGPRAHPVEMKIGDRYYHEVVEGYFARHRVRPGITGWAQVHGLRGEVDTIEKARARLAYDLEYIQRWSLWLDLEILALTVVRGFGGRNAY